MQVLGNSIEHAGAPLKLEAKNPYMQRKIDERGLAPNSIQNGGKQVCFNSPLHCFFNMSQGRPTWSPCSSKSGFGNRDGHCSHTRTHARTHARTYARMHARTHAHVCQLELRSNLSKACRLVSSAFINSNNPRLL